MAHPKTIFCDIDGTLLKHRGDVVQNITASPEILPHAMESLKTWEKMNYKIILTTGRKESTRTQTEMQLASLGVMYDQLVMGITNGERVLINDKKPSGVANTARAVNIVRNTGLVNIDITRDVYEVGTHIEKPWGYEEIIENNDKYVVKKLFMKQGHACSLQYHELKTETIVVLKGKLNIHIGASLDTLDKKEYNEGDSVTIKPYTFHRMEALEDCMYLEASTNELWDVVRLQDGYGRV